MLNLINQEKDTKLNQFFFQTVFEVDLNISLQWCIIVQNIDK